jgi:alpha-beta hydrolase superfamily lysophospholipase
MKKLFVLIRKDLSPSQQAVQAVHGAAEYMKHHSDWQNGTLVLLGVPDLPDLKVWTSRLETAGIAHSTFFEPDINEHTSVAAVLDTVSNAGHKRFKRTLDDKRVRLLSVLSNLWKSMHIA